MIEDGGKEEKGGIEVALTESGEKNERRTEFSQVYVSTANKNIVKIRHSFLRLPPRRKDNG